MINEKQYLSYATHTKKTYYSKSWLNMEMQHCCYNKFTYNIINV